MSPFKLNLPRNNDGLEFPHLTGVWVLETKAVFIQKPLQVLETSSSSEYPFTSSQEISVDDKNGAGLNAFTSIKRHRHSCVGNQGNCDEIRMERGNDVDFPKNNSANFTRYMQLFMVLSCCQWRLALWMR